jgi:hypothetical protein
MRERGWRSFSASFYRNEPFRLHTTKLGPYMSAKCAFRIEHDRPARPAPRHHPMPERAIPFFAPFDGEQRTIR